MKLSNLKAKRPVIKENPNPQVEGAIIRRQTGEVFNLFTPVDNPRRFTLHANQFAFPKAFVVKSSRYANEFFEDDATGWSVKDDKGDKVRTGNRVTKLELLDAEQVMLFLKQGKEISALPTVKAEIKCEVPGQKVEENESVITLVRPNVMLTGGFGPYEKFELMLVADDVAEFDGDF